MALAQRYSNPTGSGSQSGLNPADAWSYATAKTTLTAGQQLNHLGSLSDAAPLTFTNPGTASLPMVIWGYGTTPEDTTGARVNGSGALSEPVPVLTKTGTQTETMPAFTVVKGIEFNQVAGTAFGVQFGNAKYSVIEDSIIRNSSTNGEIANVITSGQLLNCDLIQASTTAGSSVSVGRAAVLGCRLTNPGGSVGPAMAVTGLVAGARACQIIGFDTAIRAFSGENTGVGAMSISDCLVAFQNDDPTQILTIANSVVWTRDGGALYTAGSVSPVVVDYVAAGGPNLQPSTNFGDWPVTNQITLTETPFTGADDLRLNDAAGGGALCKGVGFNFADLGAIQEESTGGGGIIVVEDSLRY